MKQRYVNFDRINHKIFILLGLLLIGSNYISSQNYIPMLGETNEWYELHQLSDESATTIIYSTKGDTVICARKYKIIWNMGLENVGMIREDTLEKKVYLLGNLAKDTSEITWYDFSLKENDSILLYDLNYEEVGNYIVDSVRMINTLGGPRRAIYLINPKLSFDNELIWVEGVGSLGSVLIHASPCFFTLSLPFCTNGVGLNCFYKDSIKVYESDFALNHGSCILGWSKVEDHRFNSNLRVYPNPVSDIATFEFIDPDRSDYILMIFNNTGQIILKRKVSGKEMFRVDMRHNVPGMYYYLLTNVKNGKRTRGKILKE